jgi:hypothetical protein
LWTAQGPSGNRLYSWKVGADRAAGCDIPSGTMRARLWNSAADRFAVSIGGEDLEGRPLPGVLVLGVLGGACRVITPEAQYYSSWGFSSDGTLLVWTDEAPSGETVIHLTAADGGGERTGVVPGYVSTSTLLPGEQQLLIFRRHGDGDSLSRLDLTEEPLREHALAERVTATFSWSWISDHWLLLADARSDQDDTFTLRAVDVLTGTSRLVSRAVTDFAAAWPVRPLDAATLRVAYMVRGRAASPQDGLWLAHLDLDDFSP